MLLTITEPAKQKFQEQLQKRGHGVGVKIATKTTGCSGLGYVMEYIDEWPKAGVEDYSMFYACLLYTSPSPRDRQKSRMPSSA